MFIQFFKIALIYLTTFDLINCYDDWVYQTIRDAEAKSENIDDCGICKLVTDTFQKGFDNTKSNMEPNYENSELRLTEIQEQLCKGIQYGKNKCSKLAQEKEELIEQWWYNFKDKETLHSFLCIRKLKLCCLAGHYGPLCKACPGHPNNICSNNGKCVGEGTRKGDGNCDCDEGAYGDLCELCKMNYTKTETGKCEACDQACRNGCFKLGKEGCNEGCSEGFREDENKICQDINECEENSKLCENTEFCQNFYGGYHCIACDKVCRTCIGAGNQCIECSKGYIMNEKKLCIPYEQSAKSNRMEIIKYLIYVAITIFSCFLMSKKPLVALIITVLFSIYVGLSEYANLNPSLDNAMDAFEELFL